MLLAAIVLGAPVLESPLARAETSGAAAPPREGSSVPPSAPGSPPAAVSSRPAATTRPPGPRPSTSPRVARGRPARTTGPARPSILPSSGCGAIDGVLAHGPRTQPVVAVTFDACPTTRSPGFSPEIVGLLERERVPTTFFVSGRWAETHPEEFARIRAVPFFEIALHGHRHRHLVRGAPDAMRAEIEEGRDALRRLGATVVPIFRPPFGDSPPGLAEVAGRSGVTALTWDVAPGDPDPRVGPGSIERGVIAGARPGSVVVLHVNGRGVSTPKALPGVLAGLRSRGFRLALASEVLAPCIHPPGATDASATGRESPARGATPTGTPSPGAPAPARSQAPGATP